MEKIPQRRHSRLRRIFRWFRILVLLGILVAVISGIYLNTVGLPDFLKRPLLAKIRAEGVQLDFRRMRLRWYRGIVVDNATFTFLKPSAHPKFSSVESELNFDFQSWLAPRFRMNSITVKNGNLIWPISKTNQLALSVSNVTAQIKFPAPTEMSISQLEGDFAEAHIKIVGGITNFSAVRAWKILQPRKPGKRKGGLEQFAATLEKIHPSGNPELTLEINGDAANPLTIGGKFRFDAAKIETPWGAGNNLDLSGEIRDWTNVAEKNFIRLNADSVQTKWGGAASLNCVAKLSNLATNNVFQTDIKFSGKQFFAKGFQTNSTAELGRASAIQVTVRTSQSFTNLIPTNAKGEIHLLGAETKWGKADSGEITFSAATNNLPKKTGANWGVWQKVAPFLFTWESRLIAVETPKLKIDKLASAGSWSAPELLVSNFDAQLYSGGIQATGRLNVASREASLRGSSDFDAQKIVPLLSPFGQRWIRKYSWETPPKVQADLQVILPAWTNQSPNWRTEVLPTLVLNGNVSVGSGAYRGITATSAKTDFSYSNLVWNLPHLRVERPEGGVDAQLTASDLTQTFHWLVHSEINPNAIELLLTKPQQRVLADFQFTTPPLIRAELFGKWNEMEKISSTGEVVLKNFSYRSNAIEKLTASLQVTNQFLRATELHLESAGKFISAKEVDLDFPTKRLFFTNISSTVDPYLVTRLIGKKVLAAIAPYRFTEPPAIKMNGGLTIGKTEDADLHFVVDGTQFKWTNFIADRVSGQVDWVGKTLLLTNVHANIYKGHVTGWSYFEFPHDRKGADLRFDLSAADIDLQTAVRSLKGKTNHLEGQLHGSFAMQSGNTKYPKSLVGNGRVNVRDGLLWDVPLFGIFSPMLNAIMPGAGNSRARQATAKFAITNGIVSTDDLEIRSLTLRMQYRGSVDFQQRIDARVEAELLRDTWVIGRLVSFALTPLSKLFEYKVTGTLSHPESEPVYIPNFLMMTLRPFHSMKKAFTSDKTNSVPASGDEIKIETESNH